MWDQGQSCYQDVFPKTLVDVGYWLGMKPPSDPALMPLVLNLNGLVVQFTNGTKVQTPNLNAPYRNKIETNLSEPGIQAYHENDFYKRFETSPYFICLGKYQCPFKTSLNPDLI